DEGVQIFGGMGFSADAPMESAYRDARISRIYEGTNEINRMLIVGMLLKKAMKGHVDLLGPATAVGAELMGIPSFDIPEYTEILSLEKAHLGRLKKAFLMVAGKAVETYGMDLEKHQELLMAAADILIEIYMVESALLRTEKNLKRFGAEAQKTQIAMCQWQLYQATELIQSKGKEAILSFAEGDMQRILLMGLKRFTKYDTYPNPIALSQEIAKSILEKGKYTLDS
ncbi:MAG TPA: acyl-CoA dehydrogenase, partial [Flavobacteriaceae bacterium]|nr:acyl-CoA dehydrogenase [Flavobacteriaceae bacterium]